MVTYRLQCPFGGRINCMIKSPFWHIVRFPVKCEYYLKITDSSTKSCSVIEGKLTLTAPSRRFLTSDGHRAIFKGNLIRPISSVTALVDGERWLEGRQVIQNFGQRTMTLRGPYDALCVLLCPYDLWQRSKKWWKSFGVRAIPKFAGVLQIVEIVRRSEKNCGRRR